MKLTFIGIEDLKQQKFVIEAEPSETIGEVKAKIASEKGWEPSTQKLIYSGKILQDDKTVESYKIEEKGFIVCMTSKVSVLSIRNPRWPSPTNTPKPKAAPSKPAPAAPATPAPAAQAATPAAPQAPTSSSTSASAPVPATPSPATNESSRFNDPSALTLGDERNAAISNMEAMGFPRDQIDLAMRAAFFNPDRAVEYLLNGIPESAQREQQQRQQDQAAPRQNQTPSAAPAAAQATGAEGESEGVNLFEAAAQAGQGGGRGSTRAAQPAQGADAGLVAGGDPLDFLRNNPQFQQLRQLVQAQPQMLEPILQQVAAGNPQIAQLIGQNPEAFMSLLAEDVDDDAALPAGAQAISVTEEEREAIERLCRLGFERDLVIQAYFACDKNEELAANFLFDQPEDMDE
ncbi:UV excision repair protein Rad23 [Aureobasidium subglaciale]|nr:UV excision repair protein Rad23 [Aureobasidium subglaciale]